MGSFDSYFPTRLHQAPVRPVDLPPLGTASVDFDALYNAGATVFEPVPEEERQAYRYWRGVHVAKIAMNFSRGEQVLNAGPDAVVHCTENYDYARNAAAHQLRRTQLSVADREELGRFTGNAAHIPLPGMVIALDTWANDIDFVASERGEQDGVVAYRQLTLDMIDPHSRQAITQLLQI